MGSIISYSPAMAVESIINFDSEQKYSIMEFLSLQESDNFSLASFEDLDNLDEGELHDKYFEFFEDFDEKVLKKRIEEEVGYSYEEWLDMKYGKLKDEDEEFYDAEFKQRKKFIDKGIEIENDFYKSLLKKKPYEGSGDNLSGTRKTCTVLLPVDYYSEEKFLDNDEIRYTYKDFPNRTNFVRLIFSHITNKENELITAIQIPGSNKTASIAVLNENDFKIENKTKRSLESKFGNVGFRSIVYYIYKFAQMYHKYPDKDTIMFMKAYALNGSYYEDRLPDNFYYELGSNENYVKRHFV